jgi:hypothetical protein
VGGGWRRKREERGHAWFGLVLVCLLLLVVCQFEYEVCLLLIAKVLI